MNPMSDEADLEAMERELPALTRLRRFADNLPEIAWFRRLGEAPTAQERLLALAYLDRLGFPDADLAILPDWEDAAGAAETNDWMSPAWEAEELARSDLSIRALELISEEALQLGLSVVQDRAGHGAKSALMDQAALWDVVDEHLHNLAVGSAVQAANGAALALLAAAADPSFEAEEHLFAAKFQLFEQGRWPIGVVGQSFNLF